MLCRTVGALAALSVGANAILLPPTISNAVDSVSDAFGFALDPKSQLFKLPCPSCAFPADKESVQKDSEADHFVWIQGGAKDLVFNFTISEDDKALLLNGVQVYPVDPFLVAEPTVAQVAASKSLVEINQAPQDVTPLHVSMAAIQVNSEVVNFPHGDKMTRIDYQIGGLESQALYVDGVEVTLFETEEGQLIITSVDASKKNMLPALKGDFLPPMDGDVPPPPAPPAAKECNMLPAMLCKWKSAVEDKLSGFKPSMPHSFGGCGDRKPRPHKLPGHIRPHLDFKPLDDEEGDRPHRHPHHGFPPGARPPHGPHGPHGMHRGPHHHGHHGHHQFLHRFVRAFVAVLIPVMAGITMGMFVSLLGMLVGRLIGFLWIKFGRGGQRGYASVAQSDQETEGMEKGVAFVDEVEEEPLPEYEDAPAYDEKEQK